MLTPLANSITIQAMSLLPLLEKIKHDSNLLKHSSRLYACGLLGGSSNSF